MTRSAEVRPVENRVLRFTRIEHIVHRTVAGLMLTCVLTAAVLYNAPVAVEIGHRRIVKTVHVICGYSLPVPIVIGFLFATYRSDMRRLNRFSRADWKWLRSRNRRDGAIAVGKFNAGQKLNAALSAGAIVVLLGTGTLMYFPSLVRLSWRTGSTFVHDWFALAIGLLVLGHIRFAGKDPESRIGMRTGSVSIDWARRQHGAWAAELEHADPAMDEEIDERVDEDVDDVFSAPSGTATVAASDVPENAFDADPLAP